MISSSFATVLMWLNALVIVALTMNAHRDAIQHQMQDMRKHLQIAGLIAVASAAMSSVILHEQRVEAAAKPPQNSSWNAYSATHTASR